MKINMLVKLALAFALIGSAVVGTVAMQKDERIVLAGDPTQWER
ncbi:hypothetical protein ACFOYU_24275 [Microvirga sp. GCM10011540]